MNEIREILTKAVVAKGRKTIRLKATLTPSNEAFSILGCWIINHKFRAELNQNNASLSGDFEVNIWYSYSNNTKTEVAREVISYSDTIRTRQIVKDDNTSKDVIVRIIDEPTCTNGCINENGIEVEVEFVVAVDVIGETKIAINTFTNIEKEMMNDSFENEINENFINENQIR